MNQRQRCCTDLSMHGKNTCIHLIFTLYSFFVSAKPFVEWKFFLTRINLIFPPICSRYIVTNRGMHAMYEKYRTAAFGRCPCVFCQGQPVLPVGLSDLPRNYTVNVFCPRCHGLYFPKSTRQANIDGAYFGTTFPHLYLMTHPVSRSPVVKMPFVLYGMILFRPLIELPIRSISLKNSWPPHCRIWYRQNHHKHTFLEYTASRLTRRACITKIMRKGLPRNQ